MVRPGPMDGWVIGSDRHRHQESHDRSLFSKDLGSVGNWSESVSNDIVHQRDCKILERMAVALCSVFRRYFAPSTEIEYPFVGMQVGSQ